MTAAPRSGPLSASGAFASLATRHTQEHPAMADLDYLLRNQNWPESHQLEVEDTASLSPAWRRRLRSAAIGLALVAISMFALNAAAKATSAFL